MLLTAGVSPLAEIGIQALGFLAMALVIFSFQMKNRVALVVMQAVGALLWTLHFFLLGQLTGAVLNGASIVRNVIYSQKERHAWARSPLVPAAMIVMFILIGVFTWSGPLGLIPVAAMILTSISLFVTNQRLQRRLSLAASPCWLVYDAICFSLGGIATELFSMISILIAIYRFERKKAE